MPYFISDKAQGCSGWATVKADGEVIGCHKSKQDAVNHMVAVSLAEDLQPGGELGKRNASGQKIIISDIDGTLITGGRLIQKTYDYIQSLEGNLFIVTGRPASQRSETSAQLRELGVRYSRLIMNNSSTASSPEYKKATAERLLKTYNVVAAIENNPTALGYYRALGIHGVNPASIKADTTRELRVDTIAPPAYMRAAARRGLKYYDEGKGGAGLVPATIREAREMAAGRVSADKWVRISAWIARHLPDLDAPKNKNAADPAYPGAGLVAHLLWGSGPTKARALKAKSFADSAVAKLKSSGEREIMTESEQRASVANVAVGDWVSWSPLLDDETEYGQIVEIAGVQAVVKMFDEESDIWFETDETALVMIADLTKIEPLMDTNMIVDDESVLARSKWIRAAWAIKARIEGLPSEVRSVNGHEIRTLPTEFEIRDSNDGMTISGYAAVFNSDSEPLPFIERVAPGAFKRSLQSRNEIKLLWNHDSGEPMASLRGGSLKLWEDAKGLAYEATLANTTRGRDVAELIRSKVIDAMSFGFNVIKDTWDERGNRILESVRLHEISVVSYPAYSATAGTVQVRSVDGGIDAEALADALLRLESGEELENEHAQIIKDVVSKLEKTAEVEEVSGNILDLKQKQLELLLKKV
jgi:HK97 family phage prohead protease